MESDKFENGWNMKLLINYIVVEITTIKKIANGNILTQDYYDLTMKITIFIVTVNTHYISNKKLLNTPNLMRKIKINLASGVIQY